ncbi:DMT family transporter [Planctomonas psychrotolerans]|uniref:DMT family transporter n=1 Tax=Planctomonas psychrotolerans TaxID=2528712 RepID=UPI001D0D8097|nr:DMT family transporter [Planctomonas psychrotolerans]
MGYLYALIAALLFGINGSVTKVIVGAGLDPAQLTFFRVTGTVVVSGLVLLVTDRAAFRLTRHQLGVMAILGVFGVAGLQFFYATALSLLPVGITLLLEYTAVLMVAVIAFFFFSERVKPRLWVSIGLVLGGLAVVAQIWTGSLNLLGVVFALLAAVALTVYFLVGERLLTASSAMAVAFWSMLFAALLWAMLSGWWTIDPSVFPTAVSLSGNLEAVSVPLLLPLLWNVLLGSFAPFFFSYLALKRLTATAAGVIASSEVIFAFLVAWVWLGEGLNPVQLVGAALVLAGIVLAQTARAEKVLDPDLAFRDGPDVVGERVPATRATTESVGGNVGGRS